MMDKYDSYDLEMYKKGQVSNDNVERHKEQWNPYMNNEGTVVGKYKLTKL